MRIGATLDDHNDFFGDEEPNAHADDSIPMEMSEDFGYIPYCPVDESRGAECFGLDEPFFGLNDPQQKQETVTMVESHNIPMDGYYAFAPTRSPPRPQYPVEETPVYDDGFPPFHDVSETKVPLEMVPERRSPVAAPPIASNFDIIPCTPTRIVSPMLDYSDEDYSTEWAQRQVGELLDFFAETVPQPDGVQSVSITDLDLLGNHRVIKTDMGPAVLLSSARSKHGHIPSLEHHPAMWLQQPTSNVLGVHHSNVDNSPTRKFQRWSPEEDDILKHAVKVEGGPPINWKRISSKYFSNMRSALQCKSRWTKALKPGILRGPWTPEEDACILRLKQEGLKWSEIAEYLPGRIAEHVSDRYQNALDPELKKTPWTPEEDLILFEEQRRLGNKWIKVAQFIPGRSENSVKNRWHNLKVTRERRMRQKVMQQKHAAANGHYRSNEEQPLQEIAVTPPPNSDSIFRSSPAQY